jgi:DHA2 family multidrug resistance protein
VNSSGVALSTALLQRFAQAHQAVLVGHVTPLNPLANERLQRLATAAQTAGGDPVAAGQQGLRMVYGLVQQQALALSYLDLFRLFAVAMVAVIPLVLLMRRSVAGKGALAAH